MVDRDRAATAACRLQDHAGDIVSACGQRCERVPVVWSADKDVVQDATRYAGGNRSIKGRTDCNRRVVVPTVKVALELDDLVSTGCRPGEPDRQQCCLRSRPDKADSLDSWNKLEHLLGPPNLQIVTGAVVGPATKLLGNSHLDGRVIMSQDERPVSHPVVDQLVAIDVPLSGTAGPIDIDRERVEVPDVVGQAAGNSRLGLAEQGLRTRMSMAKLLVD